MLYNGISKLLKLCFSIAVVKDSDRIRWIYAVTTLYCAYNGTITGLIVVLMQSAEITELAEFLGIKFTNFKSGELKANPSFTEKLTLEAYQAVMDDLYEVT
jgi:hypothetical protein